MVIDPEIPLEKGFIWFRVLRGVYKQGRWAVQVQLLEDGVVPVRRAARIFIGLRHGWTFASCKSGWAIFPWAT